jgi:transcriptional regulator with XRE-family HTH domain
LSQIDLAKQTNLNQSTISRAECGGPMRLKSAKVLARFFGTPYDEIHFMFPERFTETPSENLSQAS